jgi:hypothetical protein
MLFNYLEGIAFKRGKSKLVFDTNLRSKERAK